ncbi:hypothetical protein RHGRI_026954 [Rhododendron griersonianum]|uniref:Transmembrane protein n=1 Tax=Rhododendron griersonianum TaxID=479676 RepID=A0AAV6IZM9_9ERIC|nr:hypothetical protein RHGRI_026954 [Rhododendron griersonianum]
MKEEKDLKPHVPHVTLSYPIMLRRAFRLSYFLDTRKGELVRDEKNELRLHETERIRDSFSSGMSDGSEEDLTKKTMAVEREKNSSNRRIMRGHLFLFFWNGIEFECFPIAFLLSIIGNDSFSCLRATDSPTNCWFFEGFFGSVYNLGKRKEKKRKLKKFPLHYLVEKEREKKIKILSSVNSNFSFPFFSFP